MKVKTRIPPEPTPSWPELVKKIKSMPQEELQALADHVRSMNLKGPTVKEYLDRVQDAFTNTPERD